LQQGLARILAALSQLEHTLFALPLWHKVAAIVPQSNPQQKQMAGLNTVVPNGIRLGLLGAIAVVMWWTWPSSQLPPSLAAQLDAMNGQGANALRSLAIVNAVGGVGNAQGAQPVLLQPILLPTPTPANAPVVTVPSEPVAVAAAPNDALPAEVDPASMILVPTATAFNVVMPPVVNVVPQVRVLPGVELRRSLTPEPPTPTPTPSPTPVPVNLVAGRLWSNFTPKAAPDNDHYWVGRPFGAYATNQLASPSYQFGATAGGRYRIHHGVDISNPFGTPVLAATDGEVIHAGPDDTVLLGPYNNFFGNTVVIRLNRRLPVASGELDVFLLYGHLSQVNVTVGQQVRPEDVIGAVGMTGIAIGPHLHVEIRLGSNTYYNNVNPYLWMAPLEGQGSVAVRVLTADGRTWPGAAISIVRFSGGVAAWARQIITYMDSENIGPDPAWGENGAMDGVPAGSYYVVGVVNGERLSAEISVRAGETSFVELRTKQ
jgi:murein DD-endopeptidase MepM/ murein hydrolase activator NlpD